MFSRAAGTVVLMVFIVSSAVILPETGFSLDFPDIIKDPVFVDPIFEPVPFCGWYYRDQDGDGYGNWFDFVWDCGRPSGYVGNDDDCDDTDANEHPNQTWYQDSDSDGYSNGTTNTLSCTRPTGYKVDVYSELLATSGDCNDNNVLIHPNAAETCNGKDDDCDGSVDEGVKNTYYKDQDSDGFGNPANSTQACSTPSGYVSNHSDCDDAKGSVHPGASETCNGKDDDCDGGVDEEVKNTYYRDQDSDGYGDPGNSTQACTMPSGYLTDDNDCDDGDPAEHPGQTWYRDADADGYSNGTFNTSSCTRPSDDYKTASELTSTSGDVDDNDPTIYPDAPVPTPDIDVTDSLPPIDDLQMLFGSITVASTSHHAVTVYNEGNADLVIGNIGSANPLAAPFSIVTDNCSGQVLESLEICSLIISFAPGSSASFDDAFDIPSNDPDSGEDTITVIVSGTGAATSVPDISVTDSVESLNDLQVPFGEIEEGSSADQTVTVRNSNAGTGNLVIGNIAQADPLAAPFSIVTDNCSGQTLANSESCTIGVRFSPTLSASFDNSFDIPSNDPDEDPVTVTLSGLGRNEVPDIQVSDSVPSVDDLQISFGTVASGSSSDQTVTIANTGTGDLDIGEIGEANPLAAPMSISNDTCSEQSLSPGGNCSMIIRFSPAASGSFIDSLDIPSNDPDESTVTVNVNGVSSVISEPNIKVTDAVPDLNDLQMSFGEILESNASDPLEISLSNTGDEDLYVSDMSLSDTANYSLDVNEGSNPCGTTMPIIEANSACTVTTTFIPSSLGVFNASLTILSNDPDTPTVNLSLSGTGYAYIDNDGDGYLSMLSGGDDCNDTNPNIHPQATEICNDNIDQNCDGADALCEELTDDGSNSGGMCFSIENATPPSPGQMGMLLSILLLPVFYAQLLKRRLAVRVV